MAWLLQQPEFDSTHLQETLPDLVWLLEEGDFVTAAELIIQVRVIGGGDSKASSADVADQCANMRQQVRAMQRGSAGEAETAAKRARSQRASEVGWQGIDHESPGVPRAAVGDVPQLPMARTTALTGSAGLTIDDLLRQADSFTPNLSGVDEAAYFDYERNGPLPLELRTVANEIALDSDCDGRADHAAARERLARLSVSDAQAVSGVASRVWYQSVHSALEPLAQRLALHLADDPDFDPLPWGEWLVDFVDGRLHGHRPALISITRQVLFATAEASGEIQRNELEVKHNAQAALERMGPLERDVYGFASRNERRRQLALDYLADIRPTRHELTIYWMSRFESEQSGAQREARYATASRRLTALGENRSAISRLLGISTSVLDRIERENRSDVELALDDPILIHLAPQLLL